MTRIEARLSELRLELPRPPVPIVNFLPYRVSGKLAFLAGQVNECNGSVPYVGRLGVELDADTGQKAGAIVRAQPAGLPQARLRRDLDRVHSCLQVRGFVNCAPELESVPMVINGASGLFVAVLGEAGRHASTAVGVASLPRRAAVEVDAISELS
jgi:enamine deaminase RidA (YjgF/YER057c/UK114 family)